MNFLIHKGTEMLLSTPVWVDYWVQKMRPTADALLSPRKEFLKAMLVSAQ